MTYTPQTPLVELRHDGGFIVSQAPGHLSIDPAILNSGFGRLDAGLVCAKTATTYGGTATAAGGNTGNGTVGGIAIQAPAIAGNYTISFISPTEFVVTNPNGEPVPIEGGTIDLSTQNVEEGPGTVGQVFNGGGVGFLITDGTAAFVAGDSFTLAVTATGGNWSPYQSGSTGVTQYGILFSITDTTNAQATSAMFVRNGEVNLNELIWDTSLSAAQQDAALTALAGQYVIAR